MSYEIDFEYIKTNGITLHVAVAGPEDGELVILLHGFPDFWYGWRKQINFLAEAGYKVVAPDQRGFNKSDKPKGRKAYVITELAEDVVGLIHHFKRNNGAIIGHDWGGAVGWQLASTHPDLLKSFIAINIPHMGVFPTAFLNAPSQLIRSLYMGFFQLPKIPERLLAGSNFESMGLMLKNTSMKGTFNQEDLEKYKKAWGKEGALTSMLNWYRALPYSMKYIKREAVKVPVKIIWGKKDQFLTKRLAKDSLKFIDSKSVAWVAQATHWVNQEQPDVVNEEIIEFLNGPSSSQSIKL